MTTSSTTQTQSLFMALELSNKKWKLAFSNRQRIRQVTLAAAGSQALREALALAKQRLGLPSDAPVRSCYEAGRDGFWVHRLLQSLGVDNVVVDPASIEVPRRARRAKTDRLDAEKLVRMLMRYAGGESTLWRVVRVPTAQQEDQRRPHRELDRLTGERTAHRARVRSLLALHGVAVAWKPQGKLAVESLRDWEGQPLPEQLRAELERELARLELLQQQMAVLEKQQQQRLREPQTAAERQAAALVKLRAIGPVSGRLLSEEFFGWRQFKNRREVGSLSGLTGTPYASGEMAREQGISKAGNKRVRWLMIELAWSWLFYQSQSELSRWYRRRFGTGNARQRRIGIVALARKLLVALWKYLERGELPAGAQLKKGAVLAAA